MAIVLLGEISSVTAPNAPPWWETIIFTSLVSALFTITGAFVAVYFDRKKTVSSELIKKRISIYDDMVPKSNELFCYFLCVGNWKNLDPIRMLENKRHLDRAAHIYGPLFSPKLVECYQSFIHACFLTYTGAGKAALLRADLRYLKSQWLADWKGDWDQYFLQNEKIIQDEELRLIYSALLDQFAVEIGGRALTARTR